MLKKYKVPSYKKGGKVKKTSDKKRKHVGKRSGRNASYGSGMDDGYNY